MTTLARNLARNLAWNRAFLFAAVFAAPALSYAHHPVQEHYFEHAKIQAFYGLDAELMGVDFGEVQGTVLTAAPKLNLSFSEDWGAGARVPLHFFLSDGARADDAGLGDIDLVVKRVLQHEGLHFTLGLSTTLPTGSQTKGFGSGHLETSPFVSAMTMGGPFRLHGTAGLLWAFAGHEHGTPTAPEPVNLVAPHGEKELQYHVGGIIDLSPETYLNAVAGGQTVLEADGEVTGSSFWFGPQLGWMPSASTRVVAAPQLPIGGHRRFDWKGTLSVDLLF